MEYGELNLNRFLYRNKPNFSGQNSQQMIMNPASNQEAVFSKFFSKKGSSRDAREVVTATVITNCLIQTSGGSGRIELNSYITQDIGTDPDYLETDALVAYRGDEAAVIINKFGIYTLEMQVIDFFTYGGVIQPVQYNIRWASGSAEFEPDGWTITNPNPGEYLVDHQMGSDRYSVLITAGGGLYGSYSALGTDDFLITLFDDTGTPTDGDFSCVVFRNP